jgi:hypothetical protein
MNANGREWRSRLTTGELASVPAIPPMGSSPYYLQLAPQAPDGSLPWPDSMVAGRRKPPGVIRGQEFSWDFTADSADGADEETRLNPSVLEIPTANERE